MFDKADSDRIRQSLLGYERAAVTEWPVAASGHSFPEADNALQRLYTAYTQVQPRTDIQTKFLATSLGNLDKMSQARTERVLQARTDVGPPWSLWAVIFVTSGLLLGGAIVYGVEKQTGTCLTGRVSMQSRWRVASEIFTRRSKRVNSQNFSAGSSRMDRRNPSTAEISSATSMEPSS